MLHNRTLKRDYMFPALHNLSLKLDYMLLALHNLSLKLDYMLPALYNLKLEMLPALSACTAKSTAVSADEQAVSTVIAAP